MATAAVGPFVVQSVIVGNGQLLSRSIFDNVEACKLRTIKARKAAKRRLESVSKNERPSQQSDLTIGTSSLPDIDQVKSATHAVLQSESDLSEVHAIRSALEERRTQIKEEISTLTEKLSALGSLITENPSKAARPVDAGTKRQRYFAEEKADDRVAPMPMEKAPERLSSRESDIQEDLSSVICPFELMGSCTDPKCPHMHLNR